MEPLPKCWGCGCDLVLPEEMDRGECGHCWAFRVYEYLVEYPLPDDVDWTEVEELFEDEDDD